MADLNLNFEWIDPGGARGPELRATWASLEVRVGARPLTRMIDGSSRGVRDRLFLPLYPLAEWIVTHWWSLLYEAETPHRQMTGDYTARHSLRRVGDGFALPAVTIVPTGEWIRMEWKPTQLPNHRVEFTESGTAYIPIEQFKHAALHFVSAVVERLRDGGVTDTVLQSDFNAIASTAPDEEEFCAIAAALGQDPYALNDEQAKSVLEIAEDVPAGVRLEFFTVADYQHLAAQKQRLLQALDMAHQNHARLDGLKRLKQEAAPLLPKSLQPWEQGYSFARNLRERLDLNGARLDSLDAIAGALEVPGKELKKAILQNTDISNGVDAVVDVNRHGSPAFVVAQKRENARRFTWCRALCEYLISGGNGPLLVTSTRSERQKRNRAFAAEFLVPAEALKELSPLAPLSEEDIDNLAEDFGVSPWVVEYQLKNQNLSQILPPEMQGMAD